MSWEAFRLTSKSPSELYAVMSPSGVDHLIREMLMDCWRRLPEDTKTPDAWRREIERVWQRNMKVWSAIRKPSPEAFFANMLPYDSDGHLRQALVLCWMMLPRAGGREFADVRRIVTRIYERNVEAWEADNRTFTAAPKKRPSAGKTTKSTKTAKKTARKAKRR